MSRQIRTTNPKECFSVVRNQTFAIYNELIRAKGRITVEDDDSRTKPEESCKVFSKYSRFRFNLIGTNGDSVIANIRKSDISNIAIRSNAIIKKACELQIDQILSEPDKKTEKEQLSLAYTTRLVAGEYKGRTPAEVLLNEPNAADKLNKLYIWFKRNIEKFPNNKQCMDAILDASNLYNKGELTKIKNDGSGYTVKIAAGKFKGKTPAEVLKNPENREELVRHKEWLAGNLSRYPKNRVIMDAIDDAVSNLDSGSLDSKKISSSIAFPIYSSGMKSLSKQNASGNYLCYSVNVIYYVGNQFPVSVEIENFYAPVTVNEQKLRIIQASKKENSKTVKMDLLESEWTDAIDQMQMSIQGFANMHFSECFREASRIQKDISEELRNS